MRDSAGIHQGPCKSVLSYLDLRQVSIPHRTVTREPDHAVGGRAAPLPPPAWCQEQSLVVTTTDVPRCPVPPAGRTTWLRRSALKKGKHTRKIDFPSFPIFTKSRRVHRTGGHSHANSTVETSSTSKVTLRHRPEKLMGDDPLARGRVRTPRHAPTAAGAPGFPVPRCPLPTSLARRRYHAEDGGGETWRQLDTGPHGTAVTPGGGDTARKRRAARRAHVRGTVTGARGGNGPGVH